jgi:hypothetical protein
VFEAGGSPGAISFVTTGILGVTNTSHFRWKAKAFRFCMYRH